MNGKIEYLRTLFTGNERAKKEVKKKSKTYNEYYYLDKKFYVFLGICVYKNRIEFALTDILGKDRTNEFFEENVVFYNGTKCIEGKEVVKKIIKKFSERNDLYIVAAAITVYNALHFKEERAFWVKEEQKYFNVGNIYTELAGIYFACEVYSIAAEDAAGIYMAEEPNQVYYIKKSCRDFVLYDPLTGSLSCFKQGKLIDSIGKLGNLTSKDPLDVSMLNNMQLIEIEEYVSYVDTTKKQFRKLLETYLLAIVQTLNPTNLIIGGETIRMHDMNGFWADSYTEVTKKVNNNVTTIHSFDTSKFNATGAAIYSIYKFFRWKLEWDNIII